MLTRFDDYPIHQTSEPLAVPATTDRHAYDRYWFNGYQDDAAFYFGIGAAVYPNLGILDCGLSIVHDGEQHAFHASRRAPKERSEVEIGPFRIEIIRPMHTLRVTLDDNETGIAADLLWIPRTASFAEGFQRSARTPDRSNVHMEATRFNQFGHWQGEIRYAGQSVRIDPARVYGTKDRSWGIRPVGDPAPPGAPPTEMPCIHFLWAPLHWRDRCTHAGLFQNQHGVTWHWDGMVMPTYDSPDDIPGVEDPGMIPLAGVEHEILEFFPGTRRARHARVSLLDLEGGRTDVDLEALLVYRMKGIGYSHPEWGHGRWKGELAMAGESWKIEDCDDMALPNQHIQQVVRARIGDKEGIGVLEQIHLARASAMDSGTSWIRRPEPLVRPADSPRWSAGIVNHGSYDDLELCLASLARQEVMPVSIAVYDTGEDPQRLEDLRRAHPGVDFELGPNRGYAGGGNRVVDRILSCRVRDGGVRDGEAGTESIGFVLLLNPDVELERDFAERLIAEMVARPGVAIATGKLLRPDRSTIDSAGIVFPRHRRPRDRGSEQPDRGQYDRAELVDAASGAAMMLRVEATADLRLEGELFDEDFFAYHEDTDLCWRARRLGWSILYEPRAVALHRRGWQRARRAEMPIAIRRHSFKNHYLQLVKNETAAGLLRNLPWTLGWEILRLGFVVLRDRPMGRAYLEAGRALPGAWKKRRWIRARARERGRRNVARERASEDVSRS